MTYASVCKNVSVFCCFLSHGDMLLHTVFSRAGDDWINFFKCSCTRVAYVPMKYEAQTAKQDLKDYTDLAMLDLCNYTIF